MIPTLIPIGRRGAFIDLVAATAECRRSKDTTTKWTGMFFQGAGIRFDVRDGRMNAWKMVMGRVTNDEFPTEELEAAALQLKVDIRRRYNFGIKRAIELWIEAETMSEVSARVVAALMNVEEATMRGWRDAVLGGIEIQLKADVPWDSVERKIDVFERAGFELRRLKANGTYFLPADQ